MARARPVKIIEAVAHATVAETHKAFVALAKKEHARVMQADPKPARFTRRVDGVLGAREEAVKPDGMIVYTYPRVAEVAQAAMELLFDLSPVLSGEYRMGHTLFVNDTAVRDLSSWDGEGKVMICNYVPYARKIEVGFMKMRVPGSDHIYEQAEFQLNERFGNQARIFFTYEGIVGGAVAQGFTAGKANRRSPGLLKNQHDLRYPALMIRAL